MKRTCLCLLFICFIKIGAAKVLVVGPGEKISSLKKALILAKSGDTIYIKKGFYKESSIVITIPLTIIGETGVILDGEGKYEILTLSGRHIKVKNIQVQNSGNSTLNDFAAIKVIDGVDIQLDNVSVINSFFGIHISNTTGFSLRNSTIKAIPKSEQMAGNGIHLWKCHQADITNNYVSGHRDGIYFEFVTESIISKNTSEKNIRYGLHFMFSHSDTYTANNFINNGAGVAVMYSKKVRMEGNHFEENWGSAAYGILLKDITDSYILNNSFIKNTVGIHMEGSSRIDVKQNVFKYNGWAMKVQASCDDNNFEKNNFFNNSFDVATNGSLVLNIFNNNYWDKYEGYDLNKDGIGDVPYHPVSMYAMIVEQNPNSIMLLRSFLVSLLEKAEKAIPTLTPENLFDAKPSMKPHKL